MRNYYLNKKGILAGMALLFVSMFALINKSHAQTTLSAGDIAIIGYNADDAPSGEDEFCFILLTDITAGTTINFTDFGWCSGVDITGFQSAYPCSTPPTITGSVSDGVIRWTASTAMTAGTQVAVTCKTALSANVGTVTGIQTTGNNPSQYITLATGGDQLFAFQGTLASPTLIAGIQMNGGWQATLAECETAPGNSTQPAALSSFSLALDPEVDNGRYNMSVTSGSKAAMQAAIFNPANWDTSQSIRYTFPLSGTVTVSSGPTTPSFTGSTSLVVCSNTTNNDINSNLAITDAGTGLTETWTVSSAPSHGTLSGFPYNTTSTGGAVSPTGLSYTPTTSYTGSDAFTIMVSNGTNTATATINVTVNPSPNAGTISPTPTSSLPSVCVTGGKGNSTTGDAGGTWSSSTPSVATINSSTGNVLGVSAGTATISYSVSSGGCTSVATLVYTVYALTEPGTITASANPACVGDNVTMTTSSTTTSTPPYTHAWVSSNTTVVTINATTGVATALSSGTARISYLATGCGTVSTNITLTVTSASPGTISGTTTINTGASTTLTSSGDAGGVWTSATPAVATIGSSSGTVTGVSPGNSVISYQVGSGSCIGTATTNVTVQSPPTVTTNAATAVAATGATLNGTVNDNGTSTTTSFEYSTSPTLAVGVATVAATPSPVTGGSPTAVSASVGSLSGGVTYYFRAVGTSSAGTVKGDILSFTPTGVAATVTTNAATAVTAFGGTMNGTVDANATSTNITFEYSTVSDLSSGVVTVTATPATVTAAGATAVTANITGASAGVTYYYRVVGTNTAATTPGSILNFTTSALPASPTIHIKSGTQVTGSGAVQVVSNVSSFINEGTFTSDAGTLKFAAATDISGGGTTSANNVQVDHAAGTTTFYAQVSARTNADIINGTVNTNSGNIYVRTDLNPSATMTNAGVLTGSINGLLTNASATTGATPSYTSNLSTNISGAPTQYQWQSSPDNVNWTDVAGATTAVHVATVTETVYYRNSLTANNSAYAQFTPAVMMTISTIVAPAVTTNPASAVTVTGGTLNGDVNAGGDNTTVIFEYSTVSDLSSGVVTVSATPASVTGNTVTPVSVALTGLATTTTYYYRVSGTNSQGTTQGSILNFTTGVINTTPAFVGGATGTMVLCQDAVATAINSNLGVTDGDAAQTLTWSISSAPSHGSLTGFNATASTGAGTITPTGLSYQPTAGYSGTDAFTIQVSDGTATALRTINVTVNATPTVAAVTSQAVCNTASTTAVGFSGTGTTYDWTNTTTSIGLASTGTGNIASFTATNGGTAPVVATVNVTPSANGCTGTATTFNYTVNPTPSVTDPSDQVVCNNAATTAVNFTGSAVSGTTYTWDNTTTSIGLAATGTGNIASFTATNTGATPVVATVTVTPTANSCAGSSQTFTITVNPTPSVTDPSDQAVCNTAATTAVNFTGSAVSGTTYTWDNNTTSIGLAVTGTGNIASFTATNSGATPVVATVTVTPTANSCAGSSQTFTITVNPTPTVADPADQAVCNNASTAAVNFSGAVSGTTYTWDNNTTSISLAATGTGNIASFTATNSGTTPVVATLTVTPTANGCTGSSQTFTITVNPTPTVNDPSDQLLCNNAATTAVNFSGAVSGTTYTWSNSNTATGLAATGSGNIASFTAANATSAVIVSTVTVTPSANGCTGSTQDFTISVKPTPNVVVPASYAVCNGASTSATFSGSVSGTTYTWQNSNTSIGLASTGTGDIASFTATNVSSSPVTATVTVTPTAAGCTGSSQTFTITVNPTPNVADPADQLLCNSASTTAVTFSGTVSGTLYSWTNSNTATGLASTGTGNIASFVATNTGNTVIVSTVTVTPSANGCTGSSQEFTISVKPTPVLTDPTDVAVCNNTVAPATTFVSSVAGSTFAWTNDNTTTGLAASGSTHISAFVATNTTGTPAVSTVTVTPTAAGCVGASQTFSYTVNPTPTVGTPANQLLCNTAPTTAVNFTGNVASATYTWSNTDNTIGLASTGVGNIPSFTATNTTNVTRTGTISVTPSAFGCTGTTQSFTIGVKPTPTVADPADQVVCNTAFTTAVNFSGTVSGTVFSWTNTYSVIGLATSGTGNIASFAATNPTYATIVSTVTVTPSAAGCTGSSESFTYTVHPTPDVADPADQAVCNGTSVAATNFTGNVSGTAFSWTNNNATIGLPTSGTGNIASFTGTNSSASAVQVATVTVTPSANGCTGASQSFTIRVNPTPTMNAVSSSVVCANQTVPAKNFTGGSASNVYTWTNSNSAIGVASSGTGNIAAFTGTNAGLTAISGNFTVTPTLTLMGLTCTGASRNFAVTVNALPQVTAIGSNTPICADQTLNITSTIVGGQTPYTIDWTGPNSFIDNVEDPSIVSATTAATGTYSLNVTDANGCMTAATSTTSAVVNPRPSMTGVTNSGPVCVGATLSFTSSATGASTPYTYSWTGPNSFTSTQQNPAIAGATTAATGIYSVVVTDQNGCTATGVRTTSATVNNLPTVASVTASPTALCTGSAITLTSGATSGSGSLVSYNWSGPNSYSSTSTAGTTSLTATTVAASGQYSLSVTYTGTGCTSTTVVSSPVTVIQRPLVHTVLGGGAYCAGGSGVAITLSNSDIGKFYQLYNGGTPVGAPVAGTATTISFGNHTAPGTYIVMAGLGSPCPTMMAGSATVVVNPLPVAYNVTGGGSYCAGGTGVPVGLSDGDAGVDYTLYYGSTSVTTVAGTGVPFSFGNMTGVGSYSVSAVVTATGCTNDMVGTANVSINSLPTVFNMTGGGSYCAGGTGVAVGLSNSTAGVTYQLYNGASPVDVPVVSTGGAINFGNQTVGGTYSVVATNGSGCTADMSGTSVVSINTIPTVYTVTGGGSYCSGGAGFAVVLSGSQAGVNYQLYSGTTATGTPVAGTGSALNFGMFTAAAAYSVRATNASTGCMANMSGSAVINIYSLPATYTVGGGGSFCIGSTGPSVTLSGSDGGVSYQLYRSGSPVGTAMLGSGAAINFGTQSTPGIYTVGAVNAATGCASSMSGAATVTVNPLPVIYPVTGGGNYCTGGTGVAVGLGGSATGVNYTLFNGATQIGSAVAGTGSPISFGVQTMSGTYTVFAANATTGCTNNMSGSASIGINPLPSVYPVTGTGSYCAGGAGLPVGLGGSATGVNYSLYNGGTLVNVVAGTGGTISFGTMTASGTYTVQATNATTGCTNAMTGSADITVNTLPSAFTVTSTGSSYCAGGAGITIGLSGTTTSGVEYQLYNGATAVGTPVAGGGSVSFGAQLAAGTYSVLATNTTTGCTRGMTGTASVSINPLPTIYAVTGGGSYCAGGSGVGVSLSGSESGISYQLYNGAAPTGTAVTGSGSSVTFGAQTAAGTYTVQASNTATGCVNNMSGAATVVVNATPTAYNVTGGGSYCAGGTGMVVGLDGSNTGINYQLYNGLTAVGSAVPGTGSAMSFGLQTSAGTYMIKAVNTTTGCMSDMTGNAMISINALPVAYNVTGGGSYCAGGSGVSIGLSGSTAGVIYQLMSGSMPVGASVTGTGAALDFGIQSTAATYYVSADNGTCTNTMNGSATVVVNALPVVQTVTGGGSYCSGGSGVNVGLATSEAGVSYQLYRNGVATGSPLAGTGLALDYGLQTAAGTYSVTAYNSGTGCMSAMSGTATISINSLPVLHTVTGGGGYCSGSTGVSIGLDATDGGVMYQLYLGSAPVGSPVAGTGLAADMGTYTIAGTYTARATDMTTGCESDMSGSATVIINALPQLHTVGGGGTICQGSAGVAVVLNNSSVGVNYQLYMDGLTVGAPVVGTGAALSLGLQSAQGVYTVMAVNATTGCTRDMGGSATVIVNPLPSLQTVTGGGNYCADEAGVPVGLSSSNTNVVYQLYNGSTAAGGPVYGTGFALNFGLQTATGNYTVLATNTITGCARGMNNIVTVTQHPLPLEYTVGGGGAYCTGGTGVGVTLSSSQVGVSYQLYRGTDPVGLPVAGDGTPLDFGLQTDAGLYKILAINDVTSCTHYMSGSATVIVNELPVVYSVSGGGSYCSGGSGVEIGMANSTLGINYQLYRGGIPMGSAAGTGGELSFGLQTVAGTYTVVATNPVTGCMRDMSGSTAVIINALPVVQTVSGGGSLCAGAAGVDVMLGSSVTGISYQLYNGSMSVGAAVEGDGSGINFGAQTAAGTYSVLATDMITGCTNAMSGSATVIVNALPVAKTVTGGGSYCSGGSGVAVGLNGSQSGVSYQLYNGSTATGTAVAGSGSAISFGMQTASGSYSVMATNDLTGCSSGMTGVAEVMIDALPTQYPVLSIGSSYCVGEEGVNILLNSSDAGISYQLYNGSTSMGSAMPGTGGVIDFGAQTVPGSYHVIATNTTSGCTNLMTGSPSIIINPLPAAFTVTGGGAYCEGSAGTAVGLSGSSVGISYQLYNGSMAVGSAVSGTGGALSFGMQGTGSYVVVGTNTISGCTNAMSGSVTSVMNAAPVVNNVTGGGAYCAGGSGVAVGMDNTQTGVDYKLYRGGVLMTTVAGNGGDISFGMQTISGTYSVVAMNTTTGCTNAMNGSVAVIMNAVPVAYTVTGGGAYCSGSGGVSVGLSGSAASGSDISYQLYRGSAPVSGAVMAATGSAISFGMQTESGAYAVVATNTVTGCTSNMTGSATVTENALPEAFVVTGGGSYCSTATSTGLPVGVASSAPGISYQLYRDGSAVGAPVAGSGSAISFGDQAAAGEYTVMAKNTTTLCTNMMSGSVTIEVNTTVVPALTMSSSLGTTVCIGSLVTFSTAQVNGGTAPVYQWMVNGVNVGLGLSEYSYVPADGDEVSVTMTSSAVCATPAMVSASLVMTVSAHVMPQVLVSAMPNDTVCAGTAVTYTATDVAGGTSPVYVWKKNGVVVGAGPVFSIVPDNGDVITCEMTSNFPCRLQDVVSMDTKMRVVTPVAPEVTITANPGLSVSEGQTVKFTAHVSNGGSNPMYRWYVNGTEVSGATSSMYQTSELLDGDEVRCEVVSGGYCSGLVGDATVTVTVNTLGVVSTTAGGMDISLHPNPNKGQFVVKGRIETEGKEVNVDVTNMLGQVVYRGVLAVRNGSVEGHITLSNGLANGMYMLSVRTAGETKTFHFVMQQ